MPANQVNAIRRALGGRLPTPPEIVARHRLDLARFAAHVGNTGLASGTVLNSTAAIAAAGGYSLGRQLGNGNFSNCISAALGWHKFLITTSTGSAALFLPEGGNPATSDTEFGTGLASQVPANSPGVIAWSQANNCLGESYIAGVLASMAAVGSWPAGGFVQTGGTHHPILSYGSISPTNQSEITGALGYFKTVILGLSGDQMLSQWETGSRFYSGLAANHNDDHCLCICDCGPASTLATQYGVSVPSGIASTAFCVAGITWGTFVVVDWASIQNVASEAWVIIADPDRGDAAAWNPHAQAFYRSTMGTNGPFLAAAVFSNAV